MTRAKHGLLLVGDYTTLVHKDPKSTWQPFFAFFWNKRWLCGDEYEEVSTTSCRKKVDTDSDQTRTRHATAGAAISTACNFTPDDAQTIAKRMVESCKALLDLPSFLGLVDFVLTLPKRCYSSEDRPNDAWDYDRKIWSHHCVVYRLTVKHDATNYVFFLHGLANIQRS